MTRPAEWPAVSKVLIQERSPATFDLVTRRWPEYWAGWPGSRFVR